MQMYAIFTNNNKKRYMTYIYIHHSRFPSLSLLHAQIRCTQFTTMEPHNQRSLRRFRCVAYVALALLATGLGPTQVSLPPQQAAGEVLLGPQRLRNGVEAWRWVKKLGVQKLDVTGVWCIHVYTEYIYIYIDV